MLDRRVLAQLFVGAVVFGLFYWSLTRSGWEKQFKATGDALEKAKSFQITTTRKDAREGSYEELQEANCSGDFHILRRQFGADGMSIPSQEIEIWSVGDKHVLRHNDRVMDTRTKVGGTACGSKVLLEVPPMLNFQMIYMRGNGVKGLKKTVDGKKCREWTMQMPEGSGWGDLYTMCVDENNLPLEIASKDGSVMIHASHWNETIAVPDPPPLTTQEPALITPRPTETPIDPN